MSTQKKMGKHLYTLCVAIHILSPTQGQIKLLIDLKI